MTDQPQQPQLSKWTMILHEKVTIAQAMQQELRTKLNPVLRNDDPVIKRQETESPKEALVPAANLLRELSCLLDDLITLQEITIKQLEV